MNIRRLYPDEVIHKCRKAGTKPEMEAKTRRHDTGFLIEEKQKQVGIGCSHHHFFTCARWIVFTFCLSMDVIRESRLLLSLTAGFAL